MQFQSKLDQLEYEFAVCEENVAVDCKLLEAYGLVKEDIKRSHNERRKATAAIRLLDYASFAVKKRLLNSQKASNQLLTAIGKLDRDGIIKHAKQRP
jgi:hypothetical protein